jgi:hypothetical protein
VLSLAEFIEGVGVMCPDVVKDFAQGGVPPVDTPKASAQAYSILQRKQDATAMYDPVVESHRIASASSRSAGGLVGALVMADAGSLVSAIKHDAQKSRRLEIEAGVSSRKSVVGRELEKQRVAKAVRVGPGPGHAVRAAREERAVARARGAYCQGLAKSLGSNLTMVRRHLDQARVGTQRAGLAQATASEVAERRSQEHAAKSQAGAAKAAAADAKQVGRQVLLRRLEDGARAQRRAFEARAGEVREGRAVLRWSEARSGLIPEDPVLLQRKHNAASRAEWQSAARDDQTRVLAIRHARLEALGRPRNDCARVATAASTMDGSGLFASDGDFSLEPSISLLDLGSEVEPPRSMLAASRVFGHGIAKAHPGFLAGSSRM